MSAYEKLKGRFERIAILGEVSEVLGWDADVMMPDGGSDARGDQLAAIAGLVHGLVSDPQVAAELDIATLEQARGGLPWEEANLALMRQAHVRATAVPADLVEAQKKANVSCEAVWRDARATSDFSAVAPHLEEVVRLSRLRADVLSARLGMSPYDCLLDEYQPGIVTADLEPIFARYESFVAEALPRALERQARFPEAVPLEGTFATDVKEAFCRNLSSRIGLDYGHARLDRSLHPFCGGSPTDVRLTTRYDETNPAGAIFGVIHETGHGLYEQGLPKEWGRQPVGLASGMGTHESQSLIMEMQASQSDAFLGWLSGELAATFGGNPAVARHTSL
jgi:carboxypeptidase Taq